MSTNLTDSDAWTDTADGPGLAEARTSALIRLYMGKLNNKLRWLSNRLMLSTLGSYSTFDAAAIDPTANTIALPGHGLSTNDPIRFGIASGATIFSISGVALTTVGGGLLGSTLYYAIAVDANTLSISLTSGGLAADITAIGSGTQIVFKVPSALEAIMAPTFTATAAVAATPAGPLLTTLKTYFLNVYGGRLQGPLRLFTSDAKIVSHLSLGNIPSVGDTDATITTFESFQIWRQPVQSANHIFTIPDPTEAGLTVRVVCSAVSGGFGGVYKRADASTIGTLAAVGAIDFHSFDTGGGLAWHGAGMGGATAIS